MFMIMQWFTYKINIQIIIVELINLPLEFSGGEKKALAWCGDQEDLSEFENSQVHIGNSSPARATQ